MISNIHQMKYNSLNITSKGNAKKDSLVQADIFKKCKQFAEGIFKFTEEGFSSQPYSAEGF